MKRHKFTSPIGTNWDLSFWTPVNFEVEYFINEETEGVLTDAVTYFSDQHYTMKTTLTFMTNTMKTKPCQRWQYQLLYGLWGLIATGGVSYSVGGAAAPPTLSSATPTVWLATPIFNGFF